MEISKKQYEENIKNFFIIDCAVRSKDIFYFSLCEKESISAELDDEQQNQAWLKKRIVYYIKTAAENDRWGHGEFKNSDNYKISVSQSPKVQLISVDTDGQVFALGGGPSEMQLRVKKWLDGGPLRGGVSRCRTIDGHIYVTGGGRSVGFRKDKNSWISLTHGLPFTYTLDWKNAGFTDIDGFNSGDIYCVGGNGDVWHFDGAQWKQLSFPSNMSLYSVCCAGDGFVYISGYQGTTFRGRDQKWTKIHQGELTIPFRDMVWHDNQIWCTSDYGLWQITNGKAHVAKVSDDIKVCSGHLSSCGDVLLLAGHSGAAYMEDSVWRKIF